MAEDFSSPSAETQLKRVLLLELHTETILHPAGARRLTGYRANLVSFEKIHLKLTDV